MGTKNVKLQFFNMKHEEKITIFYIILCMVLIVFLPFLLTHFSSRFGISSSPGEIGDAIGGITSPVLGLLSAVLVYKTLSEQIKANEIISKQINHDNKIRQISDLFKAADEIIHSMHYYDNLSDKDYYGEDAFKACLERICWSHETMDSIKSSYNYKKIKNVLYFLKKTIKLILKITNNEDKETYLMLFQELYYSKYKNELNMFKGPCEQCGGKPHEYDSELISIIDFFTRLNFEYVQNQLS